MGSVRRSARTQDMRERGGGEARGTRTYITFVYIYREGHRARNNTAIWRRPIRDLTATTLASHPPRTPWSRRVDARLSRFHFSFPPASAHRRRIDLTEGPVPRSHEPACVRACNTPIHACSVPQRRRVYLRRPSFISRIQRDLICGRPDPREENL